MSDDAPQGPQDDRAPARQGAPGGGVPVRETARRFANAPLPLKLGLVTLALAIAAAAAWFVLDALTTAGLLARRP